MLETGGTLVAKWGRSRNRATSEGGQVLDPGHERGFSRRTGLVRDARGLGRRDVPDSRRAVSQAGMFLAQVGVLLDMKG
jgi:hypothetical protein